MKPSFVRVEDKNKRKELCSWLEEQGYKVCCCTMFDGWNTVNCHEPMDDGLKDVHGIADFDEEFGIGSPIELFKYENSKSDNPSVDCGEDIELFKNLVRIK